MLIEAQLSFSRYRICIYIFSTRKQYMKAFILYSFLLVLFLFRPQCKNRFMLLQKEKKDKKLNIDEK